MKKVNKKQSRFQTVSEGIRLDTSSNSFIASRSIGGKRKSKSFNTLREAKNWREMDEALLKEEALPVSQTNSVTVINQSHLYYDPSLNGIDKGYSISDVMEMYFEEHIDGLEYSSREVTKERLNYFLNEIMDQKIVVMTSSFITDHLKKQKSKAIADKSKRFSFDEDLKKLKAMLNWYREYYDERFIQSVMKKHKKIGRIKKKPGQKKKMEDQDVLDFFHGFTLGMEVDLFWRDVAIMQFFVTGRIQEVLAIHISDIDWRNNCIHLQHAAVWSRNGKKLVEIKGLKNGEDSRDVTITATMKEIIKRQIKRLPERAKFLFQVFDEIDPIPNYRQAQHRYNKALRKVGLDNDFSSTHIMRHASAKATLDVTGSFEATQAMTGHRDRKLVEHYAGQPTKLQKGAANQLDEHMRNLEKSKDRD